MFSIDFAHKRIFCFDTVADPQNLHPLALAAQN